MKKKEAIKIFQEKFNNDKNLAEDFFTKSTTRLRENLELLNQSINSKNINDIKFYVHKIKYTCSLYKWEKLATLAKEIGLETSNQNIIMKSQKFSSLLEQNLSEF